MVPPASPRLPKIAARASGQAERRSQPGDFTPEEIMTQYLLPIINSNSKESSKIKSLVY